LALFARLQLQAVIKNGEPGSPLSLRYRYLRVARALIPDPPVRLHAMSSP